MSKPFDYASYNPLLEKQVDKNLTFDKVSI